MVSLFDPLTRVLKIEIPYWIAGMAIVSLILSLINSKFYLQAHILFDFIGHFLILFAAAFILLAIYLQVRYQPYSFGELLPSSAFVALMMSAGFLIFQRSNESLSAGIGALSIVGGTAVFSPGIAVTVLAFSRILRSIAVAVQ